MSRMLLSALFLMVHAQAAEGGGLNEVATTFGVDWPHLIAQVVSFGIVCLILYRFAYRPVLKMLDVRRQQIAQGIARAEQVQAELARTEAQRRDVIAQANVQANKLIAEARAAATSLRERETQKAVAAAEQILAKGREATALEHDRMLGELKREVGRLVIEATTTVTGKILTSEDQRRLAEETTKQIAA